MKYKVLSNEKTAPGTWEVKFEQWQGCYCYKELKQVTIHKDTRPGLADIKAL